MKKMFAAIAIAVSAVTAATTLNLHLKDGTVVQKDAAVVDSITFTVGQDLKGRLLTNPVINDAAIGANDTVLLDASIVYSLEGLVYAEPGAVVSIPAGTVIKAKEGTGENASALIICAGAKIYAKGTAAKPIIMTAAADNLADDNDLEAQAKGKWGGLVVLGSAPVNTASGTAKVEGIAATESRTIYGGTAADDNSGEIEYLSLRYPGAVLSPDNEINGLTLGGVGNKTKISNVEVYNSADDGVEFFGGTVSANNILVVRADDDGFDWDFGYRAANSGWISLQPDTVGDKLCEMDGTSKDNRGSAAFSLVTVTNGTFVGKNDKTVGGVPAGAMTFREETGAIYKECIFANLKSGGLNISDAEGGTNYVGTAHFAANEFDMIGNAYNEAETVFKHTADEKNASAPQPNNLAAVMAKFTPANAFSAPTGVTQANLAPAAAYAAKGALAKGDWTAGWTFYSKKKN